MSHMNVCLANEDAPGTHLSHDRSAEVARNVIIRKLETFHAQTLFARFRSKDLICRVDT